MIILDPADAQWDATEEMGDTPCPEVFSAPHERISELLGPDGEPLLVPYERPAMGFDLRPKAKRGADQ